MPTSTKLQETFGDDVQVIFVECQNTPRDVWEAFAWKMKWMGNQALWTIERPVEIEGSGLPSFALLGIDGTVLMQGHPGDFGKKIEETVAAEIKKAKQAPAGTPKDAQKAWSLFLKGEVAAALAECDKVASDATKVARTEFVSRTGAEIDRAQWLVEHGYIGAAEELLGKLEKASKGDAELGARIAECRKQLATPELTAERDADKAFTSFVAKVAKKKPFEPANVKEAANIASKFSGTKTAKRAERFVALSKVELNK